MTSFKPLTIILFAFMLIACQDKTLDSWQTIKQTGDYRLLENYLLNNPDSEHFKEALELAIKLKDEADTIPFQSTYPNYFERNVVIIILENDSIPYCENEIIDIEAINDVALVSLINKSYHYNLPGIKEIEFNHGKNKMMISKCHFYIVVKNSIDLPIVRKVTKLIANALFVYKQNLLKQKIIGPEVPKQDVKKVINDELKNRVQFYRFKKFTIRYPFSGY